MRRDRGQESFLWVVIDRARLFRARVRRTFGFGRAHAARPRSIDSDGFGHSWARARFDAAQPILLRHNANAKPLFFTVKNYR